jgi:hypothetical protein
MDWNRRHCHRCVVLWSWLPLTTVLRWRVARDGVWALSNTVWHPINDGVRVVLLVAENMRDLLPCSCPNPNNNNKRLLHLLILGVSVPEPRNSLFEEDPFSPEAPKAQPPSPVVRSIQEERRLRNATRTSRSSRRMTAVKSSEESSTSLFTTDWKNTETAPKRKSSNFKSMSTMPSNSSMQSNYTQQQQRQRLSSDHSSAASSSVVTPKTPRPTRRTTNSSKTPAPLSEPSSTMYDQWRYDVRSMAVRCTINSGTFNVGTINGGTINGGTINVGTKLLHHLYGRIHQLPCLSLSQRGFYTIAATRTTTTTTTTNIHRQRRFNAVSSSPFEIFRRPA